MTESIPGAKRLKGELPAGTVVAHKTGTGGTRNGITSPAAVLVSIMALMFLGGLLKKAARVVDDLRNGSG